MHRIPIRQIMSSPVIVIHEEALAVDAAQVMADHTLRRLPVVNDEGFLVGIVTDADVLEAETAESAFHQLEPGVEEEWLAVREIMSREVITITADATVGELVTVLMKYKIGGLPVVQPSAQSPRQLELVGIVTETDIFKMIADAWEAEKRGGLAISD